MRIITAPYRLNPFIACRITHRFLCIANHSLKRFRLRAGVRVFAFMWVACIQPFGLAERKQCMPIKNGFGFVAGTSKIAERKDFAGRYGER
jgi:hypothetical protein